MPDDVGARATVRRGTRGPLHRGGAMRRQRPSRIDIWTDSIGVVNQDEMHA
jgi:hypothetical protein